jgi:hypothetical protein
LSLAGGYIPLAKNRELREHSGDPRLSLLERYADFDGYFARYQAHVSRLIEDRYILEEDRLRLEELTRKHRSLFLD